jgi:holo-ACP synthase
MELLAEEILEAREKRVIFQEELIEKYKLPIVAIRVNYPGLYKTNQISLGIIEEIDKVVSECFQAEIYFKVFKVTSEGPIINLVINHKALIIKRHVLAIEETHPLGRCVDIDVYDEKARGISRSQLGLTPRKCFICDKEAVVCVREKSHAYLDITSFITSTYEEFKRNKNGYKA